MAPYLYMRIRNGLIMSNGVGPIETMGVPKGMGWIDKKEGGGFRFDTVGAGGLIMRNEVD